LFNPIIMPTFTILKNNSTNNLKTTIMETKDFFEEVKRIASNFDFNVTFDNECGENYVSFTAISPKCKEYGIEFIYKDERDFEEELGEQINYYDVDNETVSQYIKSETKNLVDIRADVSWFKVRLLDLHIAIIDIDR
jgi:hypothetical protein